MYVRRSQFETSFEQAKFSLSNSLFGRVFQPDVMKEKLPAEVNMEFIQTSGFVEPFIVRGTAEIGFELPKEELTIQKIVDCLGVNHRVPVIDVEKQITLEEDWTLLEWSRYLSAPPEQRKRVYNVISLEISNTHLANKIKRPTLARELDLVDAVWPGS